MNRLILLCLLVGGLVLAPPAARAASATSTISLSPGSVILGQTRVTATGTLGVKQARPVRLERWGGDAWRVVRRGTSGSLGKYSLRDPYSRAGTYRVVAPRVSLNGVVRSRIQSASRRAVVADRLLGGQHLGANEAIRSPDGRYKLRMQSDGNLVIYKQGVAVWHTNTNGAARHAAMQSDGNFVVYRDGNVPLWSSTTAAFNGAHLRMQDDGNLVIYLNARTLWSRGTGVLYDRIRNNQTLADNAMLRSPSGQYRAIMQSDGNFVVYRSDNAVIWNAATNGASRRLIMQTDGNLVIYQGTTPVWSSNTAGFSNTVLRMQNDGNLVIYTGQRAIWSSRDGILYDKLLPGQVISDNALLESGNRTYQLIMQADGNLVLYKKNQGAIWSTSTSGSGVWATMQSDGNLVVYSAASVALWNTQTGGTSGARLILQDDGNLVIYKDATAIWDRNHGKLGGGGGALGPQIVSAAKAPAIGSYGGQCKVWAANIVNSVLAANNRGGRIGGYGSPGGAYYGAYQNAGGVLVPLSQVAAGDLIQTINPAQKNWDYPTTTGLHTAIVVGVNGYDNLVVRDSNWGLTEKIGEHAWSPGAYAAARNAEAYVWRFS